MVMTGWGKRHVRKTNPPEPGEVFGGLTAVEPFTEGSAYTRYRCQCGEEVIRQHANVRKAASQGKWSGCPTCVGKRSTAGNKRAGAQ